MAAVRLFETSPLPLSRGLPTTSIIVSSEQGYSGEAWDFFGKNLDTALRRSQLYRAVGGEAVSDELEELALRAGDLKYDRNLARVGNLRGAQLVLAGFISPATDSYEILLTLIRTETGERLSATRASVGKKLASD
jgi:hypothetical protein